MKKTNSEFKWVQQQNLDKYQRKWIAVINKKIVGSSLYADDVVKEVREKTKEIPLLFRVATEKYLFECNRGRKL